MTMNSLASQIIRGRCSSLVNSGHEESLTINEHLGKVSIDRIDTFFKETEFLDEFAQARPMPECEDDFIGFRDARFSWTPGIGASGMSTPSQFMLKIPGELSFSRGSVNVIVGPT